MRSISDKGVDLLSRFEEFRSEAYFATKDERERGILTIGFGHVIKQGEDELKVKTLSLNEAKALLKDDLDIFNKGVSNLLKGNEEHLSQHQFDACVLLAFNIGLGGFGKSNVRKYILAGNRVEAGKWFKSWTTQSGTRLKGLVRRRAIEKILYETGKDKYLEVFNDTINPYKELGLDK